ncbi:MAG: glycosyltransferase family 39 protein [Ignavibacteriales bacterium]|nr:glycosyltransferase family 39 protein [Ignavibacteriales bacterium]
MLKKITTASDLRIKLFIIVIASLLFLPFLGDVHLFDWDEINFAEASREMIETGDYLRVHIDYEPFYEKPPLFFWFQVLSMRLFGVNEFAARFPNAMFGIAALLILYSIGRKLFDKSFGLLWVITYAGSILPIFTSDQASSIHFLISLCSSQSGISIDPLKYPTRRIFSLSMREFLQGLRFLLKVLWGFCSPD